MTWPSAITRKSELFGEGGVADGSSCDMIAGIYCGSQLTAQKRLGCCLQKKHLEVRPRSQASTSMSSFWGPVYLEEASL